MKPLINPGWLFATVLALALGGCGGSSGNAPPEAAPAPGSGNPPADTSACASDCGTVLVGLTDADGDFLEYVIGVSSLSLERADGVTVETLPQNAVVDFAQYTELTEFLTAATVPPGTYVAAAITLDYSNATITVERDGEPVEVVATDPDGAALGVETLRLRLADDRPLVVAPGLPAVLIVDFDLAASHEVDLSTTPATAIAAPFLVADIDPIDGKTMRLRGPLVSVNPVDSYYVVALRPFWRWHGDFGRVRVHTTDDTAFEIDGIGYTGANGLRAMAALPQGSASLAFGALNVPDRRFMAKEVYAGSSVPGHDTDIVKGVISGRSGDLLRVRGATLVRERGSVTFRGNVEVIVGPDTIVSKAGSPDFGGGSEALSTGQRVIVFGNIATDTPDELQLDATGGRVRMLHTIITGTANDVSDGLLRLALQEIAGRSVSIFDFSGTGLPGMDADPADYEVDTGPLITTDIVAGNPLKVSGFVAPFGLAPPDFIAGTVANFSATRSKLYVGWNPPAGAPFLGVGPEGLIVDLANPDIGRRHHLVRGGILTDLLTLPGATILPAGDRPGLYAIRAGRSITLHSDFDLFTRDLADRLGAGGTVRSVYASGFWSGETSQIEARRVLVRIN